MALGTQGFSGVDLLVEEAFEGAVQLLAGRGETGQPLGGTAHIVDGLDAGVKGGAAGAVDERGDQQVDEDTYAFQELNSLRGTGVLAFDGFADFAEHLDVRGEIGNGEQTGGVGVVEISGVVGDLIAEVDQLGLERGPEAGEELFELRSIAGFDFAGMLDDSFPHLEGEVQAGETGITLFETLHDAEGVNVVIEDIAEALHLAVEFLLAGVAEGRVAEVVGEGESFGEIFIEAKGGGDGAGDLGHFHSVREAVAEMVRNGGGKDLGLVFQAAKCAGMDDAIAIAPEVIAVSVRELGVTASFGATHRESQESERLWVHARLLIHHLAKHGDRGAGNGRAVEGLQRLEDDFSLLTLGFVNRLG